MLINRNLRYALFISLLGHLLLMFSVSIVFLPSGFYPKQYSSVFYLGSILRDFGQATQLSDVHNTELRELPLEIDLEKLKVFNQTRPSSFSADREVVDPDLLVDVDLPKKKTFSLAGAPAEKSLPREREVIFQPVFPDYPEWMQQQFKASEVIFKIYISDEGLVEQIVNVQASGDVEIDVALTRYIERWRFAPVLSGSGQWQTVKIDLDRQGQLAVSINPQPFDFTRDVLP